MHVDSGLGQKVGADTKLGCYYYVDWCDGLNENGSCRLIYLNAWSPVVGIVWEGFRRRGLFGEVM